MIPRYSRPEMVAIWSPKTKFRIWYEIEAHACDAQADLGVSRITATKYLDALTEGGFVQKQKIGRGNYYVNLALNAVLAS